MSIPPRPWRVRIEISADEEECWGIVDANGKRVVETDSGYYPPNIETAQFIVKCVNERKEP